MPEVVNILYLFTETGSGNVKLTHIIKNHAIIIDANVYMAASGVHKQSELLWRVQHIFLFLFKINITVWIKNFYRDGCRMVILWWEGDLWQYHSFGLSLLIILVVLQAEYSLN